MEDSSSKKGIWAQTRGSTPQLPLTNFPPECSVLGTSIQDVGELFHAEGLYEPLTRHVWVHSPAPGIPQGHSVHWAVHPSLELPGVSGEILLA